MSRMLVAYRDCGCRVWAVLDMDEHPEVAAQSEVEGLAEGLTVVEEEHESITAHFCAAHEPETWAEVVER